MDDGDDKYYLRQLRTERVLQRMQSMEDMMKSHIVDCDQRQKDILGLLADGKKDRNALRTRMDAALFGLVAILITVVGALLKTILGI